MNNKLIRVAVSFATFADTVLNSFAILVCACLKNNALFPNLPAPLAALNALQLAFENAITDAQQGGPVQTAAKNEARDALIAALRQNAAYVQSLNLQNLSQVLSSGYDVVSTNTMPSPLTAPVNVSLDNTVTTKLQVYLSAVPNAKAYHVQASTDTGTWQDGGVFSNTRGIVLNSLTPGTVYSVRVQAVGGLTGSSDWSQPVSLMAT